MATLKKTVPNLLPNTRYTIRARTFNNLGIASDWSEALAFTMPGQFSIPRAPTDVQVNFDSPTLAISWDPVSANTDNTFLDLAHYELVLTAAGKSKTYTTSNTFFVYPLNLNKLDFTTAQHSFAVDLRAVDSFGAVGASTSFTVTNTVPPNPTTAPVITVGYTLEDITFTASILDLQSFWVEHSTNGSSWTHIVDITNNFYSHTGLASNSIHYYRFKVKDVFGQMSAGYSPVASRTTFTVTTPDTTPPSQPTITTSVAGTDDDTDLPLIDLAWAPVTDSPDLDHYDVRISVHNANTWTTYNLTHTTTAFIFKDLTPNTSYDVQVRAVDNSSNGSNWSSATVNSGHGTTGLRLPTVINTTPGVQSIFVSWDANSEAAFDHYDLYASETVGFTPSVLNKIYTGTAAAFVHDVGSSETWYYRLAIVDIYGNGATTYTAGFTGHSYATSGLTIINTDNFVVTADGTVAARQIVVTGGKIGDVTISNSAETRLAQSATLPTSTITVFSTSGFPSNATITVGNQSVTYTGKTSTTFTGCTGGTGLQFAGASVYYQGLLSGGLIRGTTFEIGTGGINFTGSGNITWQPGATGQIVVSNTGSIQSANFVTNTSGWSLGPAGLEINGGSITGSEFRTAISGRRIQISPVTPLQGLSSLAFFTGEPGETTPAFLDLHFSLELPSTYNSLIIAAPIFNNEENAFIALRPQHTPENLRSYMDIVSGVTVFSGDLTGSDVLFTGANTYFVNPIDAAGYKTNDGGHFFSIGYNPSPQIVAFFMDNSEVASIEDSGGGVASVFIGGASKSFILDHPIEENKYLVHACLEGPESAVYYRGEGQCINGQTTIVLPTYFEAATRQEGRTVQLTPIFDRSRENAQLATSSVRGGKFTVYSSQPLTKFYWEVKAVRADAEVLDPEPLKASINVYGEGPYRWFTSKGN